MGTPEYTLPHALDLFHAIGLDGAEIVVQDGYQCAISQQAKPGELAALRRQADRLGLRIIALTPTTPGLMTWIQLSGKRRFRVSAGSSNTPRLLIRCTSGSTPETSPRETPIRMAKNAGCSSTVCAGWEIWPWIAE